MKRIHRLGSMFIVAAAAWVAMLTSDKLSPRERLFVQLIPVVAIGTLGAHALLSLASGMLTFKSCPEEAESLRKEVEIARKDLAAKGIVIQPEGQG